MRLTQARLMQILEYNADTGIFLWKISLSNRAKAGNIAGAISRAGYRVIRIEGVLYYAHRLAWFFAHGEWPTKQIDHVNGKRDDNRIENLRQASAQQNGANKRILDSNRTGFKGITPTPGGAYVARIWFNGRQEYLGTFHRREDAHNEYMRVARLRFGEFARAE